ncbi:proline racemase family protein [Anaerosalibacter bizertensis]|uniref:Proline racemase family protein n=1 Tax=Anaerosalibacter bizertensis TaxID=932217 RepID=A0A9Q4AC02_9FIRM|nr:proline racemase family protein [Anaerosalibacter bizertensis]MBV1817057.1 proline racemase family protein [Bacteroidales bacterium MSK.15.36]MCB5559787.1 proline racemase family protein [Anaerosalibacter bizertensis]MCG4564821.1 proline racemase family protein [Anaerosalibacter bizertensis]MCG4582191.1 proline racemase family protein [Anaerosalibacter bizertensis]MCG4584981.1 proline racemase family protein [Anaerosalibacter bizertensis]
MMHFKHYINCIDAHTCGEPLRIITSGLPPIEGDTILEKREFVLKHYDYLRKMMMLEPRGHSGMYGCIIVPPVTEDGDFGVLFTHNEGLSSMCGHGIIAVTKVAIETGMIPAENGVKVVKIDSPAGRITAYADVKDGKVEQVRFQNVPCFVYEENVKVDVAGIGEVTGEVVYCGAFYVYLDVNQVGLKVNPENSEELVRIGMEIKNKLASKMEFKHPTSGVNWLYGTIFYEPLRRENKELYTKNICIFAEGQIDRSPTGTGTGGRVALHYSKGEMNKEDILINNSVIDTTMKAKIIEDTKVGEYDAVITEVSGTAYISGFNQLVLDPEDPLPEGFRISGS